MDVTPLRSHSSLMNCFNSHFIRFYNELKFQILSRDGHLSHRISHGIIVSILAKSVTVIMVFACCSSVMPKLV